MHTLELPDTVRKALGPEAARDFTAWLEEQLRSARPHVPISAFVARQKVNELMLEQVSNLLLADEPSLIRLSEDDWVWRVPVDLTYPSHGRAGRVGTLDVDARYGEVRFTDATLTQLRESAQRLAQQTLRPGA